LDSLFDKVLCEFHDCSAGRQEGTQRHATKHPDRELVRADGERGQQAAVPIGRSLKIQVKVGSPVLHLIAESEEREEGEKALSTNKQGTAPHKQPSEY
jgi:hypothetical protein